MRMEAGRALPGRGDRPRGAGSSGADIVKPHPRAKQVGNGPRYVPPRYIPPRLHRAPPGPSEGDIETDAVHQNLRPAR
jgi:hypothetical protein